MAKKKVSRKELLKGPDEFMTLSARAAEYIRSNQKQFQYAGVGILVVALLYLGVHAWSGSMNEEGQTAYNKAVNTLESAIANPAEDQKDLEAAGKSFEEVVENYGHSKAAGPALAQLAQIRFLEKKYPEAVVQYEKYLDGIEADASSEAPAKLALAGCQEAKGDLKSAINTLVPLGEEAAGAAFRDSALWQLGRLYKLDNQAEKAKEAFGKLVTEYPGSPYLAMAKAEL